MKRHKPQGQTGPMSISNSSVTWKVISFPPEKASRELMIAEMFVRSANKLIMGESTNHITLRPFDNLTQNGEDDLDFMIGTVDGRKRLELAEFAPLQAHGPRFEDAPRQILPIEKAKLVLDLVQMKSNHQGGAERMLLLYNTETGFWIDPITIEIVRRALARTAPSFDRIYCLSPHDEHEGIVSEAFPGRPHHIMGHQADEDLGSGVLFMGHPQDFARVWECTGSLSAKPPYGRCALTFRCSIQGVPMVGTAARRQ
jgi:hypothetical protein